MSKPIIVLSTILMLLACGSSQKINSVSNEIIGTWCLVGNQINYPTITFKPDKLATFDSKMDTVYSFRYSISKPYLKIIQPDASIIENRILILTKDSLIFETLLENKTQQVYYRCNKK
jgi:hypothetical protein